MLTGSTLADQIHDLGHAGDQHCYETEGLHLHQTEHNCPLCNVLKSSNSTAEISPLVVRCFLQDARVTYLNTVPEPLQTFQNQIPGRGPPVYS